MNSKQAYDVLFQVTERDKGLPAEHRLVAEALSIFLRLIKEDEGAKEAKKEVKTDM